MKRVLSSLLCLLFLLLSAVSCAQEQQPATGTPEDTGALTVTQTDGASKETGTTPSPSTPTEHSPSSPSEPPSTPTPDTPTPVTPTPVTPSPLPTLTPYVDEEFGRTLSAMTETLVPFSQMKQGDLLLINKYCTFDPSSAEVVNAFDRVHEHPAPDTGYLRFMNRGILADKRLIDAFERMQRAMKIETGTKKDLVIRASYMTSSEIEAQREDLRFGFCVGDDPGGSEHCAGICANVAFVDDKGLTYRLGDGGAVSESNWIVANAHRFGLIQRYTKVKSDQTGHAEETAHFRYVGIPHATYIKEHGLCLEEYLKLLKKHTVSDPIEITDPYGYTWTVYFCAARIKYDTRVPVPEGPVWSVSGNNEDGYIVTVKGTLTEPEVIPIEE